MRRLSLIQYLMHTIIHNLNTKPNFSCLPTTLQAKLRGESLGLKLKLYTLEEPKGARMILHNHTFKEYSLPQFLAECLLLKMELRTYPASYAIIDNENHHEPNTMYITLKGELELGYGPFRLLSSVLNQKNKLLCWREFIFDCKLLHPHFRV
jgi:hypothetical protein